MNIAANESSSAPPATPDPERPRGDGVSSSLAQDRLTRIHNLLGDVMSTATAPDVLELAMATAISQRVVPHGPPVWLLLEGPASGGKTTLANLLKGLDEKPDPLAVFVPKFTFGSLTGGYKEPRGNKRAPALLKVFDTCCWVNTEFSTLLTGRTETVAPILGVLTAAFDGDLPAAFGNVTEQDSPVLQLKSRFSILGCITPKVREHHTKLLSQLGPRFLTYRLLPVTRDEERRTFQLVRDPQRAERIKGLSALVAEHVRGALAEGVVVKLPGSVERILQLLAKLVAGGRTQVSGGWKDDEPLVEGSEDAARVYQQLCALTISLARIHGTSAPNARALRLVRDVALSSFEPQRGEAIVTTRTNPVLAFRQPRDGRPLEWVHGMTAPRLAEVTGWSDDMAAHVLKVLCALNLYALADSGLEPVLPAEGRPPGLYVPVPALAAIMNATFEEYPPKLVTAIDLSTRPGDFVGRLSPPESRLAADVAERREECRIELRAAGERIAKARPGLDPDQRALLAFQDVIGIQLPSPESQGS